jgi:hypothetical protein
VPAALGRQSYIRVFVKACRTQGPVTLHFRFRKEERELFIARSSLRSDRA